LNTDERPETGETGSRHIEQPLVVSACLVGEKCRYDGRALPAEIIQRVAAFLDGKSYTVVCPEVLGGLPTPRPPMEIERGDGAGVLAGRARVIDADGNDRTTELIRGAEEAARIAGEAGAGVALLKERSPSCGSKMISRKGVKIPGIGVTCALLRCAYIDVISEEDIPRQ
jgi:uncharacterized protein YbbK (DUF523 family)